MKKLSCLNWSQLYAPEIYPKRVKVFWVKLFLESGLEGNLEAIYFILPVPEVH